ncbi:hypothetical protein LuPra_00075 [Luteitalea pratensis]|uniref:Peptidase S26 domain-containing protein n=1 Tax=Luteitalea pratensis TaxID=1855912 RepID=A0A143PF56_LUTPR|nr:S26 family signal peptidase [Luteitalea pratensis]AMY06913.1 hypothetical protein LuPra_00075 [Luteitalea pratensis]
MEWYCQERLHRESDPSPASDRRFDEAERRFKTARCASLYRQFKQRRMAALSGVVTRVLLDKMQRKEARVEFVPLKRQYLHLAPLVASGVDRDVRLAHGNMAVAASLITALHRRNSSDSRHWGAVPSDYFWGRISVRWWPSVGRVDGPSARQ